MAIESVERPDDTPEPTRRERQRQATLDEIVTVSRELLKEPNGLSLRAVAQQMGITAPAMYRYVTSYQDLVYLVADHLDSEVGIELGEARNRYPDDDPSAQILATAVAFRRWALARQEEFSLLFANPITSRSLKERDQISGSQTSEIFLEIYERLWAKTQFSVPTADELGPEVAKALREPTSSAIPCQFPDEVLGLGWVFIRAWAALYGTVTLEVFGHLDPQIIESGAMFRTMLEEQAGRLGISDELPRLRPMILDEMSR